MRHPWQIWSLYAACLAIALPALGWLSVKSLQLDHAREFDRRQTELARREAELQERISSALWRMDGMLTPLIAQEAARPYYLYEPFFREPSYQAESAANQLAGQDSQPAVFEPISEESLATSHVSPLLKQPSEFVFLHFQVGPDNQISSPQRPTGLACQRAVSCCGLTDSGLADNDVKLEELSRILDYASLLLQCPPEKLPSLHSEQNGEITGLTGQSGMPPEHASTIYLDPKVQLAQQLFQSGSGQEMEEAGNSAEFQQDESGPLQKQLAQQSRNRTRGNEEFIRRSQTADNYAASQWSGIQLASIPRGNQLLMPNVFVNEGIMRPLWIDGNLFLVRGVESNGQSLIQGCWLDWQKIQTALCREVADLLPSVRFQPLESVDDVRLGQALATIPVQLEIDRAEILSQLKLEPGDANGGNKGAGITIALGIAWSCLGLAAVAGAFLLQGLIQLSERRGAFVSAVTHELRTPLTTFRMYAEMLAERMVPSPEKQQQYAQTMRIEADRLSHLVENVLQFARLERTDRSCRHEPVTWSRLWERFSDRMQQRADQASMKLTCDVDQADARRVFHSDPVAIEQIVFNLVDNACKYARNADDKRIIVAAKWVGPRIRISVRDFGPGVSPQMRRRMFRPFRKSDQQAADTAQGVGLGLALCRRMASALGGRLTTAPVECGTRLVLEIPIR